MKKIPSVSTGATKQGEHNDCVVRAITNVSGKSYDEIHALLKRFGRKDRKATYWAVSEAAMQELGYESVYFGNNRAALFYGKSKSKPYEKKSVTLKTLINDLPKGKFVVYIKGHALAMIDGKIIDMFDNKESSGVIAIFYDPKSVFA